MKNFTILVKVAPFCLLMTIACSQAFAATKTWNGSSSNNWNTAANWTPSGVPASGDDVTITFNASPQVITLSADVTIQSLSLNNSTNNRIGTLSAGNFKLTVTGGTTF